MELVNHLWGYVMSWMNRDLDKFQICRESQKIVYENSDDEYDFPDEEYVPSEIKCPTPVRIGSVPRMRTFECVDEEHSIYE